MTVAAPETVPPDARLAAAVDEYEAALLRFQAGELGLDLFKPFRAAHGVYEQRRDGSFMVRARVPGGLLSTAQAQAVAAIAAELGGGYVHLTTRQDVQVHDVSLAGTVQVMRRLLAAGLGCAGSGGNTVRNIMVCPFAGVCPRERFDVQPVVQALNRVLPSLAAPFKLPRKFKIAVSGCECDCALAVFTDLGFVAQARQGRPGFAVYAGGGMGMNCRLADLLEEWAVPGEAATAALALLRLFDRHGDRQNRAKARLRFVFERLGLDAVRSEYLSEKAATPVPLPIAEPELLLPQPETSAAEPWRQEQDEAGLRVIPQRQPGHVAVALHPPLGLLSVADLRTLAAAAAEFSGSGELCLTPTQSLLIRHVPRNRLPAVATALAALAPELHAASSLSRMTVCTGADTCRLGACLSRDTARAVACALDAADIPQAVRDGLDLRISGCGNSCGQSPVGDIGLTGTTRSENGVARPHYKLLLGARRGTCQPRFGAEVAILPADAVPQALVRLIQLYAQQHQPHEALAAFAQRRYSEAI